MRLLIDTFNFSWHCSNLVKDPSEFKQFAAAFLTYAIKYIKEGYEDVVFCVDKGSFRYSLFPEYKQNRIESAKQTMQGDRPKFKKEDVYKLGKILNSCSVPFVFLDGYEADDIIASIVSQDKNSNSMNVILSTDQDYEQLIKSKNEFLLKYSKGYFKLDDLLLKYNGRIGEEILQLKGIIGDKSDNVHGIKGIALKTALKLMDEFSTLENLDKEMKTNDKLARFADSWNLEKVYKNISILEMKKDLNIQYTPFNPKITDKTLEYLEEYEVMFLLEKFKELEFLNKTKARML